MRSLSPLGLQPLAPAIVLFILSLVVPLRGDVVINEVMAGASDRLLQYDSNGTPRLGTGVPWFSQTFDDSVWSTAPGPFGFGTFTSAPAVPIATRVEAAVRYLTPTLYLRRTFSVSDTDAARTDALQLVVQYNDGFVAYLNGVEIARRNGGPAGKFIFHDQPAYNRETFSATAPIPTVTYGESITLVSAASLLQPGGNNVLAIHALNANTDDGTFYIRADLRIAGSPTVSLVNYNDPWRYLPGTLEPSGNFFDPTLLGSGKLNVPWGKINFDDGEWASGTGPIGAGSVNGTVPATNLSTQVVNKTPSVYTRVVFSVDGTVLNETGPLQLTVQYDDGFVAYINGVEVARRRIGLPNTFTPRDAVADSDNTGSPVSETISLDLPSRLLTEGNNVLAIQVHNSNISSTDLYMRADLRTGTARTLVSGSTTWRYLVGTVEPVPDASGEEEEATAEGPDSASDWIELHNTGGSDVNLTGWSLTDDPGETRKWLFPNVTIPAGGFLVVFADGLDLKSNPGGYLHANFSLSKDGEYVGLYDSSGALVNQIAPGFPRQGPFHSYSRTPAGAWRYSDTPTPGGLNAGTLYQGIVATPTVNNPGRFYATTISVTFATSTPGATIRYTTDGSEPTIASAVASGPITVTSSRVYRVRAFLDGWIPSDTVTHTYLIAQSTARRSLPAVCITGDMQQALYRPFGIFAISPNSTSAYTGGIWSQYIGNTSGNLTSPSVAPDPTAYNAPMQSGKPAERPVSFEILHDNAISDLRILAGIRTAGSPYSRPRYVLSQQNSTPTSTSAWSSTSTEKPQLNLFFRDDLHQRPLSYPLVPGSVVGSYENIRLRAGKNDISNPFIRDEFTRRLHLDMGQVTVRGDFVTLWVNGIYKGYYNICERPREKFFQEARGTSSKFDVRYITAITDGDILAYNEMVAYARTKDPSVYANYQGYIDRVDVVNIADYLILNAYAAMADWPGNNYVMDRERSPAGRYRFSVWDGEGGFGGFSRNPAYRSTFTGDLTSSNVTTETVPAKLLYTQLKKSPEWRMLFADRIQKHFFNNGALDTANVTARYNELKGKIAPLIGSFSDFLSTWLDGVGSDRTRYTLSSGTTGSIVNVPSRRTVLFDGFYDDTQSGSPFVQGLFPSQGLWPATLAPRFNQNGGNVSAGFQLSITNPNAAGTLFYTINGIDPRAVGGAAQGTPYGGPIPISQTQVVRARVRNTNGEWSPLAEATFVVSQPVPLLLTEIMYNPLGQGSVSSDEFEFLELKNTGTRTLNLNGVTFTDGIAFTFPSGATLAPGGFAVIVKNATQFAARYPGVSIAGTYGPASSLSNSGELLTLKDVAGNTIFSVSYGDRAPWPAAADGFGNSMVVVNPNSNPDPNDPLNWRASAGVGGSPGADDPTPTLPGVLVNEVLSNPKGQQQDAIELFNPTGQPASIGGWFLSDDAAVPKKFRIPDNTVIAPGGYVVFTEADFNATPGSGTSFGLSQSGDEVRLNSADSQGNLTGYTHGFKFGAAAPGVSFGRHVTSSGGEAFPAQTAVTLGASNAAPLIGPVVITEIMYNPVTGGDEFLELRNISASPVPLYDPAVPTNTWRVDGLGLTTSDWSLPPNLTLAPRQLMILTQIDPGTFRSRYGVPETVPVYQYPGALSNGGETVAIQKPGTPFNNNGQLMVPYIDVDAVTFDDVAPWPTSPDGTGPSLERINWWAFADDVGNWRASGSSGGNPGALAPVSFAAWQNLFFSSAEAGNLTISGPAADPDGDGLSNLLEFAAGLDPRISDAHIVAETSVEKDGANGPFLTLRYRRSLSAQGVQAFVDTAGTFGAWNLGDSVQVGMPVNNGDGTETITRRDSVPASGSAQRFIRLRVLGN